MIARIKPNAPAQLDTGEYSGIDNLEVMEVARKYRAYLTSLVVDAAPPGAGQSGRLQLLDFGAGAGSYAADLRAAGHDVVCVELDSTLRDRLTADGFPSVRSVADLGDRQFDVVYTMNVLEHIEDDVEALRSLRSLVAPGGRLVVYVPAFTVLFTAMDTKVGHLRRYRRRNLIAAVERAGFTVERCEYADSLGFLATLAYRLVGSRKGDLNPSAIAAYDRFAFPVSRAVDRVSGRFFGKNLALVARTGQETP